MEKTVKGTGSTNRVKRKEGREATRARKWGERNEPKETKKVEKLEHRAKKIPAKDTGAKAVNEVRLQSAKYKQKRATVAKTEKHVPGRPSMNAIAGRTAGKKRTASDKRITVARVPMPEIKEVRAGIKLAKRVKKQNTR